VPTLDGVACKVLTQTDDMFTCRAGSKAEPSKLVESVTTKDEKTGEETTSERPKRFIGQQGLSLRRFDRSNWHHTYHWKNRMGKPDQYKDLLAMQAEGMENISEYQASLYRGWFTAPTTGKFRFHQACDDECDLNIGKTPNQSATLSKMLDINHYSSFQRNSFMNTGGQTRVSEWVDFEKDKKYYLEAAHLNGRGAGHFSMGVEIE